MTCSGWVGERFSGMSAVLVVRCIGIVISFIHLLADQSGNVASVAVVPRPGWAGCWGWKYGSKDGCSGWGSIFWEAERLGCCTKTDGVHLRGWSFPCGGWEAYMSQIKAHLAQPKAGRDYDQSTEICQSTRHTRFLSLVVLAVSSLSLTLSNHSLCRCVAAAI